MAGPTLPAMVAEADVAAPGDVSAAPPYAASWADRLINRLNLLPVPSWLTYVVLGAIGALLANAIGWMEGWPLGLDPYYLTAFGLLPVFELALIRHLDRVAIAALATFRPLLVRDERSYRDLEWRFTTAPWGLTAASTVIWIVFGLGGDVTDPAAHRFVGVGTLAAALIIAIEVAINALLGVLILKTTRQLRDVARIHREAPRIDLLVPAPLYGFSKLTSQTALGLLVVVAILVPSLAPTYYISALETTRAAFVFLVVSLVAMSTAVFVVPLYGMHRRIVLEKERLQAASGTRLTAVLAELDHDVKSGDLTRADGLNKLLASVLAERDVLARLPTWPWQAATLRAFVSALLLPVAVYVLARAAERVVL